MSAADVNRKEWFSKTTVASRFDSILEMLYPTSVKKWMPSTLSQIFREITREWSLLPWRGKYQFKSGICPDSSPIEMSLSFTENQESLLRFLTQTYDPSLPRHHNLRLARLRALNLVKALVNDSTFRWFDVFLKDYDGWKEAPKGNFFIWIGCEALKAQSLKLKIYINPWFSLKYSGFPAIVRAFELCSIGREGLEIGHMLQIIKRLPIIIGLDFDKPGLTDLKIYFATRHEAVAKSEKLLEEYGTPKQKKVWDWIKSVLSLQSTNTENQEIHFAMRFTPHQLFPTVKVNMFCQHFFSSDCHVVETLSEGIKKFGYDLSHVKLLVDTVFNNQLDEKKVDMFNFIGIGESKLDVYFRPW